MRRPDRVILLLVSLAALSACGASPRAPAVPCSSHDDCGGATWCVDHTCVENSPPLASFVVSDDLLSNTAITLDGSGSSDLDADDAVASYKWTVEVVDAACTAPSIASDTETVVVRFGCAGTFDIHLAVADTKGATSSTVTRTVTVAAGPSGQVHAGDDQTVQHRCAGSPLKCHPDVTLKLGGSVTGSAGGTITYAWTVTPPANRPLDSTRRVTFTPGPNVLDPTVSVETDGTPISGDWLFQLEVRDETGSLGTDSLRLSVANRAPVVVVAAQGSYPHTYDATRKAYESAGQVALRLSDPDGDPITHQVQWLHSGDGTGQFTGVDGGTYATFAIAVADAASLIGAPERTISVAADDGNGGTATGAAPIVVGNEPPRLDGTRSGSAGHAYTPATGFTATTVLGRWIDPDGDPIAGAFATDAPECTSALQSDGAVVLSCAAPYTGVDSLARFAGPRTVGVHASDPWTTGTGALDLTITNRAPVVPSSSVSVAMACSYGTVRAICCQSLYSSCLAYGNEFGGNTVTVPLDVSDPDGDPLQISAMEIFAVPTTVSCTAAGCSATVTIPRVQGCTYGRALTLATQASDGLVLANGSTTLATSCH